MLLFWGWGALDARDSAGAIVVLWDEDLGIIGPEVDAFSMSCHFKCSGNASVWVLSGVYGPLSFILGVMG